MARRRFQAGQLIKDGDRWIGRWREDVVLPAGTEPRRGDKFLASGEIRRRERRWSVLAWVKDATKRQAMQMLNEQLQSVNRTDYRPEWVGQFSAFADRWEKTVMIEHKPSAQSSERSILRVHLRPTFGDARLREITTEALQAWVAGQKRKLEPKTIRNVIRTLSSMWTTARAWGYVTHDPFEGLVLPTFVKGKAYTFTVDEAQQIIARAPNEKWRLFFRILAETGMRPGELGGLLRSNCQLRSLAVTQSVWARQVQSPKSAASIRQFVISEDLGRAIEKFVAGQDANDRGLVFVTEKWRVQANQNGRKLRLNQNEGGKPLSMDTFRQRVLDPILEELGIRAKVKALGVRCGNYAFRHMNATTMDGWATPLKTRQKRLGHSDPSVTLGHYTAPVDADDMRVADQFGELFRPRPAIIQ